MVPYGGIPVPKQQNVNNNNNEDDDEEDVEEYESLSKSELIALLKKNRNKKKQVSKKEQSQAEDFDEKKELDGIKSEEIGDIGEVCSIEKKKLDVEKQDKIIHYVKKESKMNKPVGGMLSTKFRKKIKFNRSQNKPVPKRQDEENENDGLLKTAGGKGDVSSQLKKRNKQPNRRNVVEATSDGEVSSQGEETAGGKGDVSSQLKKRNKQPNLRSIVKATINEENSSQEQETTEEEEAISSQKKKQRYSRKTNIVGFSRKRKGIEGIDDEETIDKKKVVTRNLSNKQYKELYDEGDIPNLVDVIERADKYCDPHNPKNLIYQCQEHKTNINLVCDVKCRGRIGIKLHALRYHLTKVKAFVMCKKCKQKVEHIKFENHRTTVCSKRTKSFQCPYCLSYLPNASRLKTHIKMHWWITHAKEIKGVWRLMKHREYGRYLAYTTNPKHFNLLQIRRLYSVQLRRSRINLQPPGRPFLGGYTTKGPKVDGFREIKYMMNRMGKRKTNPLYMSQSQGRNSSGQPPSAPHCNSTPVAGNESDSLESVGASSDEDGMVCSWEKEYHLQMLPHIEDYNMSPMFFNSEAAAAVGKTYLRDESHAACSRKKFKHLGIVKNEKFPEFKEAMDAWISELKIKKILKKNDEELKQWNNEHKNNMSQDK